MAIKIVCPRCRKPLSVPSKIAGAYANCPSCSGRFWVPESVPAEGKSGDPLLKIAPTEGRPGDPPPEPTAAEPGGLAPPKTPPLARPLPSRALGATHRTCLPPYRTSQRIPPVAASPVGRPCRRRRCPFRAGAEGGPIHLVGGRPIDAEDRRRWAPARVAAAREPRRGEGRGENDHGQSAGACFACSSISVVFSISLALIDFGGDPNADSPRQLCARQLIERDYLPMDEEEPLLPYQRYLGTAQRAHSQGNVKLERALYRRVLDMLREERGDFQKGLTGSRDRDEKLKAWISVLLREG